jgi:hypothetical protein
MRCDLRTKLPDEDAEFDAGVQDESAWLVSFP